MLQLNESHNEGKVIQHACVLLGLQFNGRMGQMAYSVMDVVLQHLKDVKLLPDYYVPRDQLEPPMQLYRIAQPLFGREAEVQQAMDSLMEHHVAVIWGGPGEGKSSIAMEVGCRLWDAGKCPGGCFEVDCLGALHFINRPALIPNMLPMML